MANPFLGQITLYPYPFAPYGWADCDGRLLPIAQYSALFSLLGTTYGGDGRTTFGLPDLQGRVPVSQGQLTGGGDYVMGETGGQESVTLGPPAMPLHTHGLSARTTAGTVNRPAGMVLAMPQVGGGRSPLTDKGMIYNPAAPTTPMPASVLAPSGGSQPHNNVQPSLVLRYCICMQGIFPSRP